MADGNFTFTINLGGNVFSGVAQIDSMMNNLSATINTQETIWNKLNSTAFKFNNIFQSAKTIISSVTNTLGGFESAYNIQASAETKLARVMRNTMDASNAEIQSIKDLASELQNLGIIGDEIQLAGAQELGTYLSKTDSLKKLLPVMNDMVAHQYGYNATQEQAVQIGTMLGKVMDGQVGALSRYGYKFDETQEQILKYGTEEQRVAVLADVITASVGGMNEAMAQTPEGKLKQQANTMGDLRENVGRLYVNIKAALLPVFDTVNEKLASLIGWFQENMDTITAVCGKIAGFLGSAFGAVWSVLGGIIDVLVWLFGVIKDGLPIIAGLAVAIGGWALAANLATIKTWALGIAANALAIKQGIVIGITKAWTAVQWLLNAAMTANPIGIIVALIAGLVTAVVICWNKFAGFRAFIMTMWETIKGFGGILKDFVIDRIKGIISGLGSLGQAIWKLFKGDFSGAWEAAKSGVRDLSGVDSVKKAASSAADVVGGFKNTYNVNLEKERAKDAEKKKEKEAAENPLFENPDFNDPNFAGIQIPSGNSPIGEAVSGIGSKAGSDNSGKIKNINVTIDKVVENFTITTTNLKEDATRVKNMVADVLVGAVNDLNYAL